MGMTKTARQLTALFLLVAIFGVLAWRLGPDGGRARQRQRDTDLVRVVVRNHLADATRLLDEDADPNARMPPARSSDRAATYYFDVSNRVMRPGAHLSDIRAR